MNTRLLFPHQFRPVGWVLFVPSALLGLASMYFEYTVSWLNVNVPGWVVQRLVGDSLFGTEIDLTNELAALGVIVGLLMIGFSKEKAEDEMIDQLRLQALQWSVYANYTVLAVSILLVYGFDFYQVTVYNMFTVLLVFIARFRWLIYRNNQLAAA